jgi:Tol biopolymer transport system component
MTGAIVGTVAYMSPEQAEGKPLDERTDIFSFGVVLYELLSGERPFAGQTEIESLRMVIDGTAPPLPAHLPEELRFIVEKALAKEPEERYQSMRELVVDLKRLLRRSPSAAAARTDAAPPTRRWQYAAFGIALVAVATAAAMLGRQSADVAPALSPEIRFEVAVPLVTDAVSLAMSPDGQSIVLEGASEEQSRLWLHSFASLVTRALPGTESASFPFWSPDGKSIGFFADGKLKRLDIETGLVRTLADASLGRGGAWGHDGTIVFSPSTVGPLLRVAALGGDARPLTRLEATQAGHRFPQFLPDGEHLLYYATGSPESRGVMIAARDGSDARRLFDSATAAELVSNHLIFSRQGALYDQPFDSISRELVGNAVTMAERVAVDSSVYRLALSASSVGSIAYRRSEVGQRQFKWFDREGKVVGRAGDPFESSLSPAMSPDGRSIAFQSSVNDNQDIWLLDLTSGNRTRFTFDPGIDFAPLWSPDGSRILFSSNRSGPFDLYERPSSGAGAETLALKSVLNKFAVDWSADGRYVLYSSDDPESSYDIWALRMDGDAEPFPVVRTAFQERDGQFSPDGRWIAYQSNDSGRWEVYVQPVRDAAARRQVSQDGGEQVRWRGDGEELFYLALDGKLMAVPLRLDSMAAAVEIGTPEILFASRMGRVSNRAQYIVSPDGSRFLMSSIVEEATRSPITVVLDWNNQR